VVLTVVRFVPRQTNGNWPRAPWTLLTFRLTYNPPLMYHLAPFRSRSSARLLDRISQLSSLLLPKFQSPPFVSIGNKWPVNSG